MAGVKISELNPTFTLNDTDVIPLARPGLGNGTTHKIYGSVFGKAADVSALQTGKVSKSGDTMTGKLTLDGDPTSPLHAATKQYVDGAVSGAVGALGKTWADFKCL